MRCGPVRYHVDAKAAALSRPFEHTVLVRPTSFIPTKPASDDARLRFHELYEEIVQDEIRNQLICNEVISAVQRGRSPIILTERSDHLNRLFDNLLTLHRQAPTGYKHPLLITTIDSLRSFFL